MHYRGALVWIKSMRLAELVCMNAARLPVEERYGVRLQMTRAAISVPSNIAEGWTRESRKEKAQFLAVAHGSLAEVHTQMLLCVRLGWLDGQKLAEALALVDEVGRMLTSLRRTVRGPPSIGGPPGSGTRC